MTEFDQEPKLIQRTEKKYDWSKIALINQFNELNELSTFKEALNTDNVKLWVNEKGTPMY